MDSIIILQFSQIQAWDEVKETILKPPDNANEAFVNYISSVLQDIKDSAAVEDLGLDLLSAGSSVDNIDNLNMISHIIPIGVCPQMGNKSEVKITPTKSRMLLMRMKQKHMRTLN